MKPTIFKTAVINSVLSCTSKLILKLVGWKIDGQLPSKHKFVFVGAPHTSNWDFILMLLVVFAIKAEVHWMGKDSLFPKPFAGFMRWLGGIAIDRSKTNNTVEQMIEHYNNNQELILIITPEGTRSKVNHWKTGFYQIAQGAGVPIVLGAIDAKTKIASIGKVFHPTGNLEADLSQIKAYYADKTGIKASLT